MKNGLLIALYVNTFKKMKTCVENLKKKTDVAKETEN
jgi:hypothetical protein